MNLRLLFFDGDFQRIEFSVRSLAVGGGELKLTACEEVAAASDEGGDVGKSPAGEDEDDDEGKASEEFAEHRRVILLDDTNGPISRFS